MATSSTRIEPFSKAQLRLDAVALVLRHNVETGTMKSPVEILTEADAVSKFVLEGKLPEPSS